MSDKEKITIKAGRTLGNWNDRQFAADTRRTSPRLWHVLDRLAGWLYRRG